MLNFRRLSTIILLLTTLQISISAQSNSQIFGIVTDSVSGEVVIGATVLELSSGRVTATNNYGYYSLVVNSNVPSLQISSIGYNTFKMEVNISSNNQINVKLSPQAVLLDEASVMGQNHGQSSSDALGKLSLTKEKIERIPVFLGEPDAMKALQTLPGVSGAKEGSSEIVVRGGGTDQNLTLLDGAPVYNMNHALGLLSLFNTEIIKDVTLYKGGVPARFGGRASSVLEITGREGDARKWKGTAALSTIAIGGTIEGPIVKDKLSLIVSARRSWPDLIITNGLKLVDGEWGFGARFYDINSKLNYQINDKQRLFLSFYSGSDKEFIFSQTEGAKTQYDLGWGNQIGSLRWNSIWGNGIFSQTTAYVSSYFDNEKMTSPDRETKQRSNFVDGGVTSQFSFILTQNQTMKAGFEMGNKWFKPYSYTESGSLLNYTVEANQQSQISGALFVEHETTFNKLTLNIGLRYDYTQAAEDDFSSLQPRLSAKYRVDSKLTLKGGVMQSSQALHAMRKSTNGTPIYTWIPSTNNIPPMSVWQYSMGAHYCFNSHLSFDVEGYYKDISNTVAGYEVPASDFAEVNYDKLLHVGTGKAFGVETLIEGTYGRSNFTSAYTLAKADNTFSAYNQGKSIPSDFDVRQNWVNSYTYNILTSAKKVRNFSAIFSLNSGYPLTLAAQEAQNAPLPLHHFYFNNYQYINYPNNARMPLYHRLDVNYQTTRKFKRGYRTWTFGILNLYNKQNTYLVVRDDENQYKQVTAFPILPYISYKTEF